MDSWATNHMTNTSRKWVWTLAQAKPTIIPSVFKNKEPRIKSKTNSRIYVEYCKWDKLWELYLFLQGYTYYT